METFGSLIEYTVQGNIALSPSPSFHYIYRIHSLLTAYLETIPFFNEGETETDYAIGKVTMNKVSDRFTAKDLKRELRAYFVTFYNGARTRLHYHESDQILIATEGIGFVEIVKRIEEMPDGKYSLVIEDSTEFKDGESVIIPAGKIHWHGAKKGSKDNFSHIAILRNTPTIWL